MLEWNSNKLKKMFPNLVHEIDPVIPTIFDHFERCRNEDEAIEIIDFYERKEEISSEMANHLRKNIKKFKGLFGNRKVGDYERRGKMNR